MNTPLQSLFSRLIRHTLPASLAAALCAVTFSAPSIAQQARPDVVGVALGMTPDQVEAILKARNPKFQFVKVYWRGEDGKPSTTIGKLGAALPSGPNDRINTSRGYSRPEAVMVYFTLTEGKVFAVYRQFVDKRIGVSAPEMEAQLAGKYGPPDAFKGTYRLYRRMLDAKGQPDGRCGSRGFDWQGGPGSASKGCGWSLEAQFSDPIAPDVYQTFQTWMLDHAAAERDALTLQARREVTAGTGAKAAQGEARTNAPGL